MAADPRGFAIILFVALTTISAYFLHARNIGATGFAACLLASAFATVIVVNADRLQDLFLKWGDTEGRIALQQLRNEVYAKVEELQKIAQGVASFTAASIASENRFSGLDSIERMLRRRDELLKFLAEAGIAELRAHEIVTPIERMADWDLRIRIVSDVGWNLKQGEDPTDPAPRAAARREIESVLQKPDRLAALDELEALLQTKYKDRMDAVKVAPHIKQYRELMTAGRLPKIAPADDMKKAPLP